MPENVLPEEFFYDLAARASDRMMEELPSEEELSRTLRFSPGFERRMERFLANPKLARTQQHRALRVLAIAAVIFTLLVLALMSVSAVRTAVFKFFTALYEKYIVVWYAPEDDALAAPPETILEFREPAYIPEGYEQTSIDQSAFLYALRFTNTEGSILLFEQTILDNTVYEVLIEEAAEQECFEINGTTGMYRIIDEELTMVWTDNCYSYKIFGNIDTDQAAGHGSQHKIK